MKLFYIKCVLVVALPLLATPSFSRTVKLYGFESAKNFKGKSNGKYYLQVGSFADKSNAYRYQRVMQSELSQPVKIEQSRGNYTVVIGPIRSAAELRALGQHASLKRVRVPVHKNSKHITVHHPQLQKKALTVPVVRKIIIPKEKDEISQSGWYLAADLGVLRTDFDQRIRVHNGSDYPEPFNKDQFSLEQNSQVFVGVGGGYRWERDSQWLPAYSLGLRYKHIFLKDFGNTITQYSKPEFTNYNYDWNIYSDVLLASTKLNLFQYSLASPYVGGGLGVAFNRASSYQETALPGITPRVSPAFTNHTSSQFAYNLGAGVDFRLTRQFILSLSYEYQDLGKISSGRGMNTWAGQKLNLDSYQSNAALLSFNYLFDAR